jgi:2-polyprenyl-3-methyl-5-hydroxy-6-metoxy-1,4-benzoquinol methylase
MTLASGSTRGDCLSYQDYEIEKGWAPEAFGSFSEQDAVYFGCEIGRPAPSGQSKLNILEVGFGNGQFLGWAASQGHTAVGIELNERLIQRATERGFNASTSVEGLPDQAPKVFDLIVAFDVIEHIERDDLIGFLRHLQAYTNKDTQLVFRFPNGDNPFAAYLQNGDWTHRTAIGSLMIKQLAALAGYDVVAVRRSVTPMKGTSLRRRAQLLVGWPLRWLLGSVIRYVFMGGMPVQFSANLVAVLKPRPAK